MQAVQSRQSNMITVHDIERLARQGASAPVLQMVDELRQAGAERLHNPEFQVHTGWPNPPTYPEVIWHDKEKQTEWDNRIKEKQRG